MNPGRRLNHAQCHQTIVGTDAKMPPKFCQNCGFCNPSKLPRFSPSAFVRLIVCVWFPTFCRINGNFIVTDWAKVERSQKSDGTQSFPTNIYKPKISHCTISPNCQFFNLLKTFKRFNMGDQGVIECADKIAKKLNLQGGQSQKLWGWLEKMWGQPQFVCGWLQWVWFFPQRVWVTLTSVFMKKLQCE